ncbi:HAD family hydrolase [Roseimarinus sediminis]|uniref:HAD family hydrolase n=1 Tax=Roseimarinus sediminis TaxID=1610899 RepID=UPI003D194C22
MKYKCIIFDNDGILVDSELIANRTIVEMAAELGVNIDLEYAIKYFSGVSIAHTLSVIEAKLGQPLPDGFELEFRKRTYEAFITDLKPVEGVVSLLEKLDIPFCVASSGPFEKLQLSLQTTGLFHFFEGRIFSSYEIGSWKPEPDIFLYAAQKMGFQASECAVIEDSLAGVDAARKGGFDVYALSRNGNASELAERGASVFYSMDQLYDLL